MLQCMFPALASIILYPSVYCQLVCQLGRRSLQKPGEAAKLFCDWLESCRASARETISEDEGEDVVPI